ncbi:MAG TPA: GNAT family N-acetyltransferase [Solirubrobacteraceae bacterium]|nr:GNAT family N-acetyltransferase [Solirubrobacteraceae bacterium]
MLELELRQDREPPGWDGWVEALGGGPFHCAGWARYRSAATRKRALFFTWFTAGSAEPAAVALAIDNAVPGPFKARSIEFDAPPATRLDPRQLSSSIEHWVRSQGTVADAWLGSFDAERGWRDAASPVTRVEFRVKPAAENELLARMRTLARRSLRRAQRSGIEVDPDSPRLREFVDLYGETLTRLRQAKGVSTVLLDPEEFARQLASLRHAGAARLFMAAQAGAPVAGAVFTVFGGRAFYLLGASNERGRTTGAMTAVLFEAMRDLSATGFDSINLGGVSSDAHLPSSSDHGLYSFKRGLGGAAHPCRDVRIVVRPVRRRLIRSARATRSRLLQLAR